MEKILELGPEEEEEDEVLHFDSKRVREAVLREVEVGGRKRPTEGELKALH